jgi:hypothetical protein
LLLATIITTMGVDIIQACQQSGTGSALAVFQGRPYDCIAETTLVTQQTEDEGNCLKGYEISLWFGYICICFLSTTTYLLADRYYRALGTLRSTLANFDVANTNLGVESDRVLLLNIINQLFTNQGVDDRVADVDGAPVADAPHPDGDLSPHTSKAHEVAQQVAHLIASHHPQGQEETLSAQHNQPEAHTAQEEFLSAQHNPTKFHTPQEEFFSAEHNQTKFHTPAPDQPEAHTPAHDQAEAHTVQVGPRSDSHMIATQQSISGRARRKSLPSSGLAAFNLSVRTDVYNQLPISGIRAWNIYGYCMSVLIYGTWLAFNFYDSWGFINPKDEAETSGQASLQGLPNQVKYKNWRSIAALAYYVLVMNPFLIFWFSAQIKLFLWLYELSGLPRWAHYAIFLPLYLVFDMVLMVRLLVIQNIVVLVVVDLIAGTTEKYTLWYSPVYAVSTFIQLYHDGNEPLPEWVNGYVWTFDKQVWIDVLLWIFLVVPITIFTYWLYEPMRLQKYRLQFCAFLMQKLFGARDANCEVEHPRGAN